MCVVGRSLQFDCLPFSGFQGEHDCPRTAGPCWPVAQVHVACCAAAIVTPKLLLQRLLRLYWKISSGVGVFTH